MNALNENLIPLSQTETDSKKHWNASLPYPVWPFGTVNPAELKKWGRLHAHELQSATIDDVEEAPF